VDGALITLGGLGFASGVYVGFLVPPPLWAVLVSGYLTLVSLKVLVTPTGRPEDLLLLAGVTWVLSCPMIGGALGAAISPELDE
jgi:hypothetical protein